MPLWLHLVITIGALAVGMSGLWLAVQREEDHPGRGSTAFWGIIYFFLTLSGVVGILWWIIYTASFIPWGKTIG